MALSEILRKIIWSVDMQATITAKSVSNIVQYNIVAVSTVIMYKHMHRTKNFGLLFLSRDTKKSNFSQLFDITHSNTHVVLGWGKQLAE